MKVNGTAVIMFCGACVTDFIKAQVNTSIKKIDVITLAYFQHRFNCFYYKLFKNQEIVVLRGWNWAVNFMPRSGEILRITKKGKFIVILDLNVEKKIFPKRFNALLFW